jgi:hypothetical protein
MIDCGYFASGGSGEECVELLELLVHRLFSTGGVKNVDDFVVAHCRILCPMVRVITGPTEMMERA